MLQLKSAYKDGTTHIVMAPLEFMQRLAALVPGPRLHLIRFHGVLAPNAKLRGKIIPSPAERATEASTDDAQAQGAPARMSWASLRHGHRTLPELRRQIEDHRCDRRSAGDCQNPQPSRPAHPRPAARASAAIRFIPNGLRAETGYQRKPSPPLALSLSELSDGEPIARFRPLHRPSYPKQHRDFH